MTDNRGRLIEQLAAGLCDAFEYVLLFATEQALADSAQVGAKQAYSSEPLLLEAEIHSKELIGLGQPPCRPVVDLGEQPFVSLTEPLRTGTRIDQVSFPAYNREVTVSVRIGQTSKPVRMHVDVVVEERDDLVTCLGHCAVAGVAQAQAIFTHVLQTPVELLREVTNDRRRLVIATVVDDQDFVILGSRVDFLETAKCSLELRRAVMCRDRD